MFTVELLNDKHIRPFYVHQEFNSLDAAIIFITQQRAHGPNKGCLATIYNKPLSEVTCPTFSDTPLLFVGANFQ